MVCFVREMAPNVVSWKSHSNTVYCQLVSPCSGSPCLSEFPSAAAPLIYSPVKNHAAAVQNVRAGKMHPNNWINREKSNICTEKIWLFSKFEFWMDTSTSSGSFLISRLCFCLATLNWSREKAKMSVAEALTCRRQYGNILSGLAML